MAHKGELHPGEHEGIITDEVWEAVQEQLQRNSVKRHRSGNTSNRSLLTGLLIDENGDRLVPTYANKSGRRYRYYVSATLKEKSSERGTGWRLPAPTIEKVVLNEIRRLFRDKHRLIEVFGVTQPEPGRLESNFSRAARLSDRLRGLDRPDQHAFLQKLVKRIELRCDLVRIVLCTDQLQTLLEEGREQANERPDSKLVLDIPIRFKRRGVEMKLILTNEREPKPKPDPILTQAVAEGHGWFEELRNSTILSVGDLAKHHEIDQGGVSRRLPLAFLAPGIVEAILEGRHPTELTAARMMRIRDLPLSWGEQRQRLGFAD